MKKLLILGVMAALFLSACSAAGTKEENTAYHKVTPEEAKEMMDNETVTIVDVRTAEEYEEGHVPGAILLDNNTIGKEQPEELPDKDAKLLIYCRSGKRSKAASDKLVEMGYQNVYDFGGIIDWPYETTAE